MQVLATVVAELLCHAAMMALSLTMDRHYGQLTGQREVPAIRRRLLRVVGWALLLLAAMACIGSFGLGVGVVTWCALLTMAALAVACGLTYRPRQSARVAALTLVLGLFGAAALGVSALLAT